MSNNLERAKKKLKKTNHRHHFPEKTLMSLLKNQYLNLNMLPSIKPIKMLFLRFLPSQISPNMKLKANRYYLNLLSCTQAEHILSKSKIHHSSPSNIIVK